MNDRAGFSLVEVLVALVILSVGLLGMQAVTTRYLNIVTTSDRRAEALQLVRDQLDEIRTDPAYSELATRYAHTETEIPEFPGLTRETTVLPPRAGTPDFTRVTVTVTGAGLGGQVLKRSLSVGAP